MPRARLIYNPTAGREVFSKRLVDILEILELAGYETSCKATEGPSSGMHEARKAAEHGFDVVIAAGGDGTIHEVVNGLAPFEKPPKLGILPAGTINDLARALKIPRNFIKACEVIAEGKVQNIDLGKSGDQYFINAAAIGHLTEASDVSSNWKTVAGPFAYYMKVVEKLGKISKPFTVKITTDKGVIEDEIILLFIANTTSLAGFGKLTPRADISDGLLDVLMLSKCGIPHILHIAALAARGEHIHDTKITYFQTSKIKVEIPDKLKFNLDGEWVDISSGIFEVVPSHLQIFVP